MYGCAGGDLLIAARTGGQLAACSFAAPVQATADQLRSYWPEPAAFAPFRSWPTAQEPCQSCQYLSLCRGGCRVVSSHVSGDARAPDPECPRVIDYRATLPSAAERAPPSRPELLATGPRPLAGRLAGDAPTDPMTQRAKRHLKVLG